MVTAPERGDGDDLASDRLFETRLELARNGIGFGWTKIVDGPEPQADCLKVEIAPTTQPYIALWHFWGPYFESGQTQVTPAWANGMRAIVSGYAPGRSCYRVSGYTDTAASEAESLEVSRRRADNVARELIRQGVREADIETRWFGEAILARQTADGVAEPLNRRVHIDVLGPCSEIVR